MRKRPPPPVTPPGVVPGWPLARVQAASAASQSASSSASAPAEAEVSQVALSQPCSESAGGGVDDPSGRLPPAPAPREDVEVVGGSGGGGGVAQDSDECGGGGGASAEKHLVHPGGGTDACNAEAHAYIPSALEAADTQLEELDEAPAETRSASPPPTLAAPALSPPALVAPQIGMGWASRKAKIPPPTTLFRAAEPPRTPGGSAVVAVSFDD